MSVTILPTFSPEQLAQWQKERERLLGVIAESQQRLQAVNQILSGANMLTAGKPEPSSKPPPETKDSKEPEEIDPTNFMGTIAKIVNDSKTTLSKKELKAALIAAGVPEDRVKSAYFYVAINRLYANDRITVYDDGTVGKAEQAA
jgi:hypothetical protein